MNPHPHTLNLRRCEASREIALRRAHVCTCLGPDWSAPWRDSAIASPRGYDRNHRHARGSRIGKCGRSVLFQDPGFLQTSSRGRPRSLQFGCSSDDHVHGAEDSERAGRVFRQLVRGVDPNGSFDDLPVPMESLGPSINTGQVRTQCHDGGPEFRCIRPRFDGGWIRILSRRDVQRRMQLDWKGLRGQRCGNP